MKTKQELIDKAIADMKKAIADMEKADADRKKARYINLIIKEKLQSQADEHEKEIASARSEVYDNMNMELKKCQDEIIQITRDRDYFVSQLKIVKEQHEAKIKEI